MIIDAPGHKEFLKNMVTGASIAEAAILVIDANEGIKENSKRHCYMLSILGIRNVTVVINKMDLVDFNQAVFDNIVSEYKCFLNKIDVNPTDFIPVSGYYGDNVVKASENILWYNGKTILEALDAYPKSRSLRDKPFRMYVQAIYKFTENGDQRKLLLGLLKQALSQLVIQLFSYHRRRKARYQQLRHLMKIKNKLSLLVLLQVLHLTNKFMLEEAN